MEINFDKQTSFTWGLEKLDKRFGRPDIRELIILYGMMSSGKTEFSFFTARKNSELDNKVCYISLELPEYDMKLRIARKKAGIGKNDFQEKRYSPRQKEIMTQEFKNIDSMHNIYITSPQDKTFGSIQTTIRKHYDIGCRMFFIDNLDKILADDGEDENGRYNRITASLQDMKNESDMCIILIHHAKKADSKSGGYARGGLTGMRGSQKIMDNATQVFEIYRDLDPDISEEERSWVEIIQMKDTFEGANGVVQLKFDKGDYVIRTPEEKNNIPKENDEGLPF